MSILNDTGEEESLCFDWALTLRPKYRELYGHCPLVSKFVLMLVWISISETVSTSVLSVSSFAYFSLQKLQEKGKV